MPLTLAQGIANQDKQARHKAERLGAEFSKSYDGKQWSWRWGMRSSADQYCILFDTEHECAEHFLKSREGKLAIAADERRSLRNAQEAN